MPVRPPRPDVRNPDSAPGSTAGGRVAYAAAVDVVRCNPLRRPAGPIVSTRNQLVREFTLLHDARGRRDAGLVLIEGPTLVAEAVAAGLTIEVVCTTVPDHWPDAVPVEGRVLERMSTTSTANEVVAIARRPAEPPDHHGRDLVVLVDVADPGNVGALIRSAAAFGFGVRLVGGADPWSPKALRAGAGGHFQTTLRSTTRVGLDELHSRGFVSVATVARGGAPAIPPGGHVALLIGSEAHGLPEDLTTPAMRRLTIPTTGVESLNAAVAGSVAMYARASTR